MYWLFEAGHAVLNPYRALADAGRLYYRNPANPFAHTEFGKSMAAACEMFERSTRRYEKPDWRIDEVSVDATRVKVTIETVWRRPFCHLLHFRRDFAHVPRRPQPRLLIVAPMSGHHATLLRGTVRTMLANHDVYITDWRDAEGVPLAEGGFDLDDYIDYVIEMIRVLSKDAPGGLHLMAVCQPAVPVLAAVARMEAEGDPDVPASMTLMGGPIDTRESPTAVNNLALDRGMEWFRRNVITTVPWPHAGVMRPVYPGFLQLNGFMAMNFDRHLQAHSDMFRHLVKGDGDSAEKHREFYDEYLAVMDLSAEFYLQTIQTVFIDHALPRGGMRHRGQPVDPSKIRHTALLTIEGENDDISGIGQTKAAHRLAPNIPEEKRVHYMQPAVGHYGVFNGSRFRADIAPRISDFILSNQKRRNFREGDEG
ncbi:polyhydroxyalkanoate depolymerase [Ancylobacter sp. 6x-1]|uniref:Polyhydroxyalkanoate depolymerase n=2 Tax=Ancylobacter crimeensis TaxID=2579147 RepID=A0ABT0DDF5_9HYPH|nr:polyhydroxyalkanoate depolymerase [Ancylobacter crimeensis]